MVELSNPSTFNIKEIKMANSPIKDKSYKFAIRIVWLCKELTELLRRGASIVKSSKQNN
jgi:hypothetical protein